MLAGLDDATAGAAVRQAAGRFVNALLAEHAALDACFVAHRRALVEGRLGEAQALWRAFDDGLRAHVQVEERGLLPVYARDPAPRGGAVPLFGREHQRILGCLNAMGEAMARLVEDGIDRTSAVLALLDQQASFNELMEHHDLREQRFLYPAVIRMADAEAVADWCRLHPEPFRAPWLP